MTPQELRSSILQLAIQGKLVEQRPEEGTAEDFYIQIQQEKQALIKAGKIKKEKPLPEITEDEIPFDIPESWKWVKIGRISILNPKNNAPDELSSSFIPMTCVCDGFRNTHTFEVRKWGEIKKGFSHFVDGDVGVAKITPCFQNRKSVIFQDLENGFGAGTTELSIVRCIEISNEYLLWFFKTEFFISNGVKSFTGTAGQQRIHKDYLANCPIPLPPLPEQKRIVAKIEELLPLVDRYEQAWQRLEVLNSRFPVDMQKSVLQLAIQGKLVPQLPEEGTGEDLFRQIQSEKQTLIKAGKIKKEKPLPEITEDEIPFDIPESWKWVRISDVIDVRDGTHDTPKYVLDGVPLVTSKNLVNGTIDFDTTKLISYEDAELINLRSSVDDGDILFAMIGTIGNPVLVKKDREFCIKNMALFKNIDHDLFDMNYLLLFLQFEQSSMKKKASGGVQSFVSLKFLRQYLIPLPPLAEQKRIVVRLEELLPLCEMLR